MTADPAPDVPRRWLPDEVRPNTEKAWAAAWTFLSGGGAHRRVDIITVMRATSPISVRTAREVLIQAVADGSLTVVERDRFARPTLKRTDR